jgi:hypothetical protein
MPLPLGVGYMDDDPETLLLFPLPDDVGYIEDEPKLLMPLLPVVGYIDDDPEPLTLLPVVGYVEDDPETYPILLELDVGYTELEFPEADSEMLTPLLYVADDELMGYDPVTPPLAEVDIAPTEDDDPVTVFP